MERMIAAMLAPLRRRVLLMVGRAILTAVNDATKSQTVQVATLADSVRDDVERYQDYGITSVPLKGAEGVIVLVGGSSAHGIVIATEDRRYRPTGLNAGDVALYTDKGIRFYIDRDGDIVNVGAKEADDYLAKASITDSRLDALEQFAASHVHPDGMGGTGTAPGAPSGSTTATSVVKGS
jgi:phage baseplate assembly protein V